MDYYKEIIQTIKEKNLNKQEISKLKLKLCLKYKSKKVPTDIEILLHASPQDFPKLKQLQTKPVRTLSGVTVVAIMAKPFKCPHGKCVMCPGGPGSVFGEIPQSYTGEAPATMRAKRNLWDSYLQVFNRLEQYAVLGHSFEKVDLIIMGGTFPSTPKKYQEEFVMYALKAMNDFSKMFYKNKKFNLTKFKKFFELPGKIHDEARYKRLIEKMTQLRNKNSKSLSYEQNYNDFSSNVKCIGMTIETRPDYGLLKHGNEMLNLGCTRVELGVQSTDENIIKQMERGHTVKDSILSTKILKNLCFKINYHLMPGSLGSTKQKDLEDMKEIVLNPDFRPDMIKIYPCMVFKGTKLYNLWKKGKYSPLTTKDAIEIIAKFKEIVPKYMRIMRVQRDIPTKLTEAGVDKTNLRQYIHKYMEEQGTKCQCIRCREPKNKIAKSTKLEIIEYFASEEREFFISIVDKKQNIILGFCRLRFPSESLRKEITKKTALIRELHVYGSAVKIGEKGKTQHKGFGKQIMKTAEKIAKENNYNKIAVISGIGVRGYYRKLGYRKQGPYMVKKI